MDDDKEKSIVEKTVQTVKDIASTVSDAAKHAMEPEPSKEINFEESAKNDR